MKTRVKYYNGYYYPQVRRFLCWLHIETNTNYAFFKSLEEAITFIENGDWVYRNKVMWESE